jgi:putative endonuclease
LYYRVRGYRVLETNVRAGRYELDLVVRRGSHLVFCEVKMRSSIEFGDPVDIVGFEKRRRLRLAGEAWLARHPKLDDVEVSFEVIGIRGRRLERLQLTF